MAGYHKEQRHRFIISVVLSDGVVNVSTLANCLRVHERTVRRDLKQLEREGLLVCCYGGANLPPDAKLAFKHVSLHNVMKKFNKTCESPLSQNKSGKVFVLGSFNTDLVYQVQDFASPGETIQALSCTCLPGGKGCNQAIASVKANARTYFAVKLGNDEFALKALDFLQRSGFERLISFRGENCPTGTAVVTISTSIGDNQIVISPGANQQISHDEILSCRDDIETSDVFLTQMENNYPAVLQAVRMAYRNNIPVIFNPAPWRKEVSDLLPLVEYLTPNLTEAGAIVNRKLISNDDVKEAAEIIHSAGVRHVIITMGRNGCWYYNGNRHRYFEPFLAMNVDTSGAGDAFNGSLATRIAQHSDVCDAITYAQAFASLAVEREGASNMPEHEMVLKRLAREGITI
ncbi:ribokinase [Salmonella enterica subsp. enterica serovar Abony]|nr:DeoR family transcriptional regulator [Salmonella enterica subsp. enterica serovar Richmond]EBX6497338.1 ribokinase [Salmonella enterica subsp. enterica serovar Abony]EJB5403154.1 DeoR family transcriptional regulator [Salmonella enterica]ELH0791644.1 DeoR family transcriptional regulator [Salmonella enterica]HAK7672436.1 DeoR family transcriptional regulator [Salmonella enterica]